MWIGVNPAGYRVGESHPQAVLTWADVDLIRELHEEHGITVAELARKFECAYSTVRDVVEFRTWVTAPRWVARRSDRG